MRNSTNVQVKVNPFKHTCQESTVRNNTISRAKSRWMAEEVKKWVKENQQVGPKELQKNIKDKFKIDLPYMRLLNAFGECFEEGFDENVGQQPVVATDDENDGQERVTSDEDFDELCGRFEEDAQGTENQEEKIRSNEHKVHEEQSDGKKLKDQTEAPTLFMSNYEIL
ncbi:hypothetical protein D1007_61064 [Hordeum vulgare]|nr:hypothetical protein D1007_61064 [Hordeum vulgare]